VTGGSVKSHQFVSQPDFSAYIFVRIIAHNNNVSATASSREAQKIRHHNHMSFRLLAGRSIRQVTQGGSGPRGCFCTEAPGGSNE